MHPRCRHATSRLRPACLPACLPASGLPLEPPLPAISLLCRQPLMAACRSWFAALLGLPAVGPAAVLRCMSPEVLAVRVEECPVAQPSACDYDDDDDDRADGHDGGVQLCCVKDIQHEVEWAYHADQAAGLHLVEHVARLAQRCPLVQRVRLEGGEEAQVGAGICVWL